MNAGELFKAGKLQQAIDAQVQEVKAQPANPDRRVFLFELLAFAGDLDRARKHIDAVQYGEMERDAAATKYRQALDAEQARRRFFKEGLEPKFLLPPPEHVQLRLQAAERLRAGQPAEALALLNQAAEQAPHVRGVLNDNPFTVLRDCDDLFAGVLEVFAQGVYYWLPLEQIQSLGMNPPQYPRDLMWFPARLMVREGPSGEVLLPALYPGTHEHTDDQIRLGRATDWKAVEGGPVLGAGTRVYLVEEEAIGLLEWREMQTV